MKSHLLRRRGIGFWMVSLAMVAGGVVLLWPEITGIPQAEAAAPTSGLIGHWKLDEGSGTTAADSSGNDKTGTLTNGPVWAPGKINSALSFDGVNDYVSIPSTLDVSALPFTLSTWVRPSNYADYGTLITKRTTYSSSGMRFDLLLDAGTGRVRLQSFISDITFSYSPPLTTWTHIAVVINTTNTQLYVNGVPQQSQGAFTLGSGAAAQVSIGNAPDGPDQYAGQLDDVRIYNRALSAVEISDVYNDLGGPPDIVPPTVSISSPSIGATVSGTISITADASDDVAVAGVQFKLDGANLGAEDTIFPYSISWTTASTTNGAHTLTAVAGDTSANTTVSNPVSVIVDNAVSDTVPPSVPTGLSATAMSSSQINLSWIASTDNIGVAGYRVFRNGTQIATPTTNAYSDTGLSPSTTYAYTAAAYDAVGNVSAPSTSASATTLASPPPPLSVPFTTVIIEAGQAPWGKNVGDLDGDGQLDLIEGGGNLGGNVYWYSYPSWTKFQIGSTGGDDDLRVGDIDNDGAPDVVVNGGTYWYENPRGKGGNAQGLWTRHTIDAANDGHDLALGDVNADGKLDVLTRREFGATTLYIQGATPDAWTAVPMPNAPNGEASALADINRDGRVDIVGNGYWLQQPETTITSGTLWIRRDFGAWPESGSADVADINGDGRLDVFLAASEVGVGTLSWFEAPLDPINDTWIKHDIDTVADVHRFHLIDMNNDGSLDIAFAEMHQSTTKRVGIYYNNGNGASWTLQVLATTASHNIAVGDIGHDGDIDIVGANWNLNSPDGGSLNLWRNDSNPSDPYKVLIFSKTLGFRHASIATGIAAIQSLGAANNFTADATEDSNLFTDANLAQYKAVIFLNPSGNILDVAQQGALQRFIESGKGFVGVHNATALLDPAMDAWAWYNNMLGAKYQSEISTGPLCLQVLTAAHPSTASLPNPWCYTEEAYNFDQNPKALGAIALLNLDEATVSGGTMGADHPFSWYKPYDGGRMWYTTGGANDAEYSDVNFRSHILGGIKYTAGVAGPIADTTAPSVSLTAPLNGATVSATLTVSADASDNVAVAGVQFKLDGQDLQAEDTTAPYAITWNAATVPNGAHALTAAARDAAGNTATSDPVTVIVDNDTTPPVLSGTAVTGLTATDAVIVWTTDEPSTSVVEYGLTAAYGGAAGGGALVTSHSVPVGGLTGETLYHYRVRSADGAGNLATSDDQTFTTEAPVPDSTAPAVSLTGPADGATVSATVTISAAASDNVGVVGVQFVLDGAPMGAEDMTGPYTIAWDTTQAADGAHALTAIARDAAGNTTTSAARTVTVNNADTTPPTVSLTAPANNAIVSGNRTVSASASDNVGVAGVKFQLDGADIGVEDTVSPYSITWNTRTATNGVHTLTAIARDAAGNTTTSAARTVTTNNDLTAPTVAMSAPAEGSIVSGTSVKVSATASDNIGVVGVRFKLDGVNLGTEDTSAPYSRTWNSRTATNGPHVLTATARDAAGNTTTSADRTITVNNDLTAPSVPTGLTATLVNRTRIDIRWDASTDNVGVTQYRVYRNGVQVATRTTTTYSNTNLTPNTTYTYTVAARDAAGNMSAQSVPLAVTTLP